MRRIERPISGSKQASTEDTRGEYINEFLCVDIGGFDVLVFMLQGTSTH